MGENESNELRLDTIIRQFFDKKNVADSCKKEADKYNSEIKDLMAKMNIDTYANTDGLQAKITVQKRESFDEPKLIEKLIDMECKDCINLVPVVDYDKLEDLIYNGKLDASKITDCKQIKEVVTLKVVQKKGE